MKQHGIRFHEGIPDSELLPVWFPTRWQEVQDTFRKVTERPFGYMLLDLHPKSSDDQRILSHLLKEEGCMRCHQLKQDATQ